MSHLVVRARSSLGAIRLADAVEIFRPLPATPLAGPPFLLGLAVVRGAPTPVVDLGALLGSADERATAFFVAVRAGSRRVALAVEGVLGIRSLERALLEPLPPLARSGGAPEAVGALDRELIVVLSAARLLPEEVWRELAARGAA